MTNELLSLSEPWLQYAIRINLLDQNADDLAALREEALLDSKIQRSLRIVADYHSTLVTNHKNPDLPIHKLLFLLDLGFDTDVPEIELAVAQLMDHRDKHGVYQSLTNIPKHFGGTGEDGFGWCLCDAPLLLLALIEAGVSYEKHIRQGVDYLVSLEKEQGFLCSVSEEFGTFRGPGRKDDCCPYATLVMLRLLSRIDGYRNSETAIRAIDALLDLWERSRERHPYMFYMGTDFRKLKAPAIWYDIVGVADCLSVFEYARADARFGEMVEIIRSKQDEDGLFTPQSVYQRSKGWDFGQKKTVSPYLSFLCLRILKRCEDQLPQA